MEKIHTFKKFCSGEYLSHLQKIQFFRRFDCGHLLNISHICKDSDIQKIPLPENTIFKLRTEFEYNLSTSLHFTQLHFTPLCLPHIKPLCATSLRLPFCLPHFVTPSVIFASLHLTSRHFTSHILSAPLHATSLRLLFFLHHFPSLCPTSLRLPSLSLPHFTPLHIASRFFLTRFTSFHATSLHLPFCPPHFTPLHATLLCLVLSASLHATSRHFTPPPVIFTSLHTTSCHFTSSPILSASLHATSLYFTSSPFFSPHFATPHLISSIRPLRLAGNASPKKYLNAQSNKNALQPASQPFERFPFTNLLNICHICKRFRHSKDSNFFPNLLNVLKILLTSLFFQKIQIFERFKSGESLK